LKKGVDEAEKPAIMGGSLRRNFAAHGNGAEATSPDL
jgi:hypothetical protein